MNIATASVLLSLAIAAAAGAPTASAARGAKAIVKHHAQPTVHVKVAGATRVGVSGGCVSAIVDEYFTTDLCNGGVPFGPSSPASAPTVESGQSFSSLAPATAVVPGVGSAAGSSTTGDSSVSDASDSC
jgi:hypothetical protein